MDLKSNEWPPELAAAVLQRLLAHLRDHPEVQNIDLMNLAGFCRNCLSNWLQDAAEARGQRMDKDQAREWVYGMPYAEWKSRFQKDASAEQLNTFAERQSAEGRGNAS